MNQINKCIYHAFTPHLGNHTSNLDFGKDSIFCGVEHEVACRVDHYTRDTDRGYFVRGGHDATRGSEWE